MDVLAQRDDLHYILSLHEGVALAMAAGYAEASGKIGVSNFHVAPGLGNALGLIYTAYMGRTPLLVTAGQQDRRMQLEEPLLWGDLVQMSRPYTKWSYEISRPEDLPQAVRRAIKVAMTPPTGPVFLSLPMEYLFETMTKDVPSDLGAAPLATADPKGIEELADMLAGAKNPVIIAEDSGRTPKGVACLVEIAALLGCPVVETRSTGAINIPRTHPLHSGFDPKEVVQGSDVIFLLAVIAPWHPASITP